MELLILCIKIFLTRVLDVSLGTVRTIVTIKGKAFLAATIGFIEVLIWFLIVREALSGDSNSIFVALAYAGGYATGTLIGSFLSEIFIKGNLGIQVVLSSRNDQVIKDLRSNGYGVTVINGSGKDEEKYLLILQIEKHTLKQTIKDIKNLDQDAFIVVQETKLVQNGFFKKS